MAETLAGVDSRDPTRAPEKFSAALAAAVFCQDPPQIFDMADTTAGKAPARARSLIVIARRKADAPETYAPFTIDEYRRMPLDYAFIDECGVADWPARTARIRPCHYTPARRARWTPRVPVLVSCLGEARQQ